MTTARPSDPWYFRPKKGWQRAPWWCSRCRVITGLHRGNHGACGVCWTILQDVSTPAHPY